MLEKDEAHILFESVDRKFLDASFAWLEDEGFRKLILAERVNKAMQEKWYSSLTSRTDYFIWGVKCDHEWIGACGIKGVSRASKEAEYWGYIYPENMRRKKIGSQIFAFCREKAIAVGVEKLWLTVARDNESALNVYLKWGFVEVPGGCPNTLRMERQV